MDRSAQMRAIRSKNTVPEVTVRSLLHRLGYRFRLHRKDLPGKPDIVFPSRRKAILVHGCFWHSHNCKTAHIPKQNQRYWVPKLQRNRDRDIENLEALAACGWNVQVIWECELAEVKALKAKVQRFLES
jgi:DNA mismatch endonuclease (patch repair protein)